MLELTTPVSLQQPTVDLASALGVQRPQGSDRAALEKVAGEFEGIFFSMMINQLRQSLEPDTLFSGDRGDTMGGLFDMFMGQHMAKVGRLGVADLILRHHQPTVDKAV